MDRVWMPSIAYRGDVLRYGSDGMAGKIMSEWLRLTLQYAGNIFGCGFLIVLAFAQLVDYFTERRTRHLVAALGWFVLVPVFVLRTAGVPEPPLIPEQIIADGTAIGWAVALFFGVVWGVLKLLDKKAQAAAQKKLMLNGHDTDENSV